MKMRGMMVVGASTVLTIAVTTNAWLQKKQFYPTVVYLTKSSPSVAVLYIQAFVFVFLFGKLVKSIFFGQLRPAEIEHMNDRFWYAVTDTCLAFTLFRDDFSPIFVGAFTLLLFLKTFHWLLEDRVDFMERSPRITFLFKIRVMSLLMILLLCDLSFVNLSYHSTITKGPSVQIVFGFEYAILATIVLAIFLKYILHTIDLQSENPWENKVLYMLYVEIVTGFFRVLLYICFTVLMVKVHTFPLFSIRPMYLAMRQFKKAVSDIVLSRRAIQNMNNLYPDATAEELSNTDSTCIICREEMSINPPPARGVSDAGVNKKLPCGHIFHASCLRSWFQRQQTCPTCRLDVLQTRAPQTPAPPQQAPPAPPGGAPPPRPPFPPQMFPHPHVPGFPRFPPAPPTARAGTDSSSNPTTLPNPPPLVFPPLPSMIPPFFPPPAPPSDLSGLTDEQVREMEGTERRHVEARIECLRNVNLLLDCAMTQISQYMSVVPNANSLHIPPPFFAMPRPDAPSASTSTASTSTAPPPTEPTSAGADPQPINSTSSCSAGDADAPTTSEDNPVPDADELRRRRLAKLSSSGNDAERKSDVS